MALKERSAKTKCKEKLAEIAKMESYCEQEIEDALINWTSLSISNVMVKKSSIKNAGRGVFSNIIFEDNDCIAEYNGTMISNKKVRSLINQKKFHYIAMIHSLLYIDGNKHDKDGVGSLVNDNRKKCNARLYSTNSFGSSSYNKGKKSNFRVFIIASKKILPNEEIFICYGRGYWLQFDSST